MKPGSELGLSLAPLWMPNKSHRHRSLPIKHGYNRELAGSKDTLACDII